LGSDDALVCPDLCPADEAELAVVEAATYTLNEE